MTAKKLMVLDSLFDPLKEDKNVVKYFKGKDNKPNYKVWIFLEGKDTYYVDHVIYKLHNTFRNPVRKVNRSIDNPNCSLIIWTWGLFELGVEIVLKNGEKILVSHYMSYGQELKKKGLKFEEENPITPWNFY